MTFSTLGVRIAFKALCLTLVTRTDWSEPDGGGEGGCYRVILTHIKFFAIAC